MLEKRIKESLLKIEISDITLKETDAITYYASHDLSLGSGFGNAIAVRGGTSVQEELKALGPLETGEAAVSGAGELKCSYIIHAVGPRFQEEDISGKLRKTLKNALKAAEEKGVQSIAFPPLGTGFYGVPLDSCASIMLEELSEHLLGNTSLKEVIICANDKREYNVFRQKLENN
jgi:O-acetyl-ADP-ribose deacetylase (regulator of RNase III)